MNWKLFTLACVSVLSTAIPQNIIGCGGGEPDPYDYYYHFFNAHQWDKDYELEPYYYTGVQFLYSGVQDDNATEELIREWKSYFGKNIKDDDIGAFIFYGQLANIQELSNHLRQKTKLDVDSFFLNNSLTQYFLKSKDLEALNYIRFAKEVEPYALGSEYNWEAPVRDSLEMAKLIQTGIDLHKKTKKDFFKLKYAYQIVRLAHYSDDAANAIVYYDKYVAPNKTESVLQHLSLSLKAGALFRMGKTYEAAYYFSRVFSSNKVKKSSNFLGFNWSVKWHEPMDEYLKYCKNKEERLDMLAMFGYNISENAQHILDEMYQIDPASKSMEVLAVREINKAEENYLTPMLHQQPGSADFLFYWWGYWREDNTDRKSEVEALTNFLEKVGNDKHVKNPGLYNIGAAYCAMMLKEYDRAELLLNKTNPKLLNESLQNQWQITRLMLTLNTSSKMDANLEAKILPTFEWLDEKIKNENSTSEFGEANYWRVVYRNLFSEVLGKKYHAQNDPVKEVLSVGAAGLVYSEYISIDYFRKFADASLCMKLHAFFSSEHLTPFEKFLKSHNILDAAKVSEFAGTAFLRDQKYAEAIVWLEKDADAHARIGKNPFIELLYDQENYLVWDTISTSKLEFAREMLRLEQLVKKGNADALYKYALGLYNTTYYGYAWELVDYYRSGTDGYYVPKDASIFYQNYYGAYAAHDHFEKALKASKDKEFKAKCLFMMAKCSQKHLQRPRYEDFKAYQNYSDAEKKYEVSFYNNIYFPQFINEYGKTKFYQQAFNSCSYLRDFVKQNGK